MAFIVFNMHKCVTKTRLLFVHTEHNLYYIQYTHNRKNLYRGVNTHGYFISSTA